MMKMNSFVLVPLVYRRYADLITGWFVSFSSYLKKKRQNYTKA